MRVRAMFFGAVVAFALYQAAASPSATQPSDDPLAKATQYVARFEQTFSSVLWHEHYVQNDHIPRKFTSSGTRFMELAGKRDLESDMLLLWIPRAENWIAVRDVLSVDGVARAESAEGLGSRLERPNTSLDDIRRLAADNGRFNIGQILRTFSEPTLTLLFLDARNRHRFTFKSGSGERVGSRASAVYHFSERERPTIVRGDSRDVPARGRIWIDPQTGEILQTFLELNDRHDRIAAQMTVRYGDHAGFDVLVPLEMREIYKSDLTGEQVTAVATYSDFRKFETAARIISR